MAEKKDLQVFERRAQEAERQISVLTKKLEQIELEQKNQRQAHAVSTEPKDSASSGDVATITKARDELVKDNKALKAQIEKLNYRIDHLVRSLEATEKRSGHQ